MSGGEIERGGVGSSLPEVVQVVNGCKAPGELDVHGEGGPEGGKKGVQWAALAQRLEILQIHTMRRFHHFGGEGKRREVRSAIIGGGGSGDGDLREGRANSPVSKVKHEFQLFMSSTTTVGLWPPAATLASSWVT